MIKVKDITLNTNELRLYLDTTPDFTPSIRKGLRIIAAESCMRKSRMALDNLKNRAVDVEESI